MCYLVLLVFRWGPSAVRGGGGMILEALPACAFGSHYHKSIIILPLPRRPSTSNAVLSPSARPAVDPTIKS